MPAVSTKFLAFLIYISLSFIGLLSHEMWRDEWQAINLANQLSLSEIFAQLKYEGHPFLWFILIKLLYQIYPEPITVRVFHWLIACMISWLILFRLKLPLAQSILIIFGYFFLFEFSILTRNYNLVILCSILLVIGIKKNHHPILFFIYSLVMCFSNIYGLFISGAFAILFLHKSYYKEAVLSRNYLAGFVGLQVCILLIYSILLFPPEDNCFNNQNYWSIFHLIRKIPKGGAAFFNAFIPFPGISDIQWDRNFLDQIFISLSDTFQLTEKSVQIAGYIVKTILIAPVVIWLLKYFYRSDKFVFIFLITGWSLIYIFQSIIHYGALRHHGFLFIVLLLSFILLPEGKRKLPLLLKTILFVHLISAFVVLIADFKKPFSNAVNAAAFIKKVYGENQIVFIDNPNRVASITGYYGKPVLTSGENTAIWFTNWNNCEGLKMEDYSPEYMLNEGLKLQKVFGQNILLVFTYDIAEGIDTSSDAYHFLKQHEVKKFTGSIVKEDFYIYAIPIQEDPS